MIRMMFLWTPGLTALLAGLLAIGSVKPVPRGPLSEAAVFQSVGEPDASPTFRHPIDVIVLNDRDRLLVLNRTSATISLLSASEGTLIDEFDVGGGQPTDMCRTGSNGVLVVDQATHQLHRFQFDGDSLASVDRIGVPTYPMQVALGPNGDVAFVTSRWSQRLTRIKLNAQTDQPMQVTHVADLEFAPHQMLFITEQVDSPKLFVADAFGGRVLIVEPDNLESRSEFQVPGHNIRGMATTDDQSMVLFSHQMLNELAHTVRNDVHWGLLMSNDLRWLSLESILSRPENVLSGSHMHPLGQAGHAAGDPTDVCMTSQGEVVVAIGGVDEVSIGKEEDFSLERIKVGRRPVALDVNDDGTVAYVANMFDDTISVVNIEERRVSSTISLGVTPDENQVVRGERLFFDASLSHDGWMSCHSCHTDGHSNGLLNDNLTDESFGAPKRVLSLLGAAENLPLAWDGSVATVQEQIAFSVKSTMQGARQLSDDDLDAITAFLLTLEPAPALNVARGVTDEGARERGEQLFESLNCVNCHQSPNYTSADRYQVGLVDEMGRRDFNPPSLRGVSQRPLLFHDNRAAGLKSVLVDFQHRLDTPLTDSQLSDLLEFLNNL